MKNETLVIYHGGCRDGFCAAWVINKYFTENGPRMDELNIDKISYIPAFYGQNPPNIKDKDVIIVDFSYDLETMKQIGRDAKSVIWLDHHKTAEPIANSTHISAPSNMFTNFIFDITRSGAGLAWDYFFGEDNRYRANNRPWLVDYVEDRDLWSRRLQATDTVNAYIACLEFDFNVWDTASNETVGWISRAGEIAIKKTEQYVREVCKNVYFADIKTHKENDGQWYNNIPVVNICQVDCSEVLHQLCVNYPESNFSLYWFKRADGIYQYGLRSIGDFDVSNVAKLFGGGGHKNAAGFQLDYLLEELK